MMSKTFEEFYSELNSMNTQDIDNALVEASINLEKCTEPFTAQDIIRQQQETINRQKAEIERLREEIAILDSKNSVKDKLLAKAESKMEAMQMDKEQLESDVINANMNCEHLQAELERLKKLLAEADITYNKCAKRFYKEGVKEFAERLKEKEFASGVFGSSYCREKIDNLVKEMVGEG